MVKLSLLVMVGLTVAFAFGLRWREERLSAQRPPPPRPARGGSVGHALADAWIAGQKRKLNRWVTAAALAAIATMLLFGGINWLRIWNS